MSDPKVKPTLYNVIIEGMDVTSSLHCPPDPIKEPDKDAMFLDELDEWAKHASQHASACIRSASKIEEEMHAYREQLLLRGGIASKYDLPDDVVSIEEVVDKLGKWLGRN